MAAAAANVPSSVSATYALPPGADVTKFHCLYPVYLDKSKTLAEGRRLPLSQAVPSPTIGEILMVAQQARIPMAIEPRKSYSRDYLCVGRLRYLLHKPDSEELYNPEIPDKHAFMARIAAGIAEIPNRKIIDPITMFLHPHGAPASAPAAAAAAASPSAASDSKSKKKGKK